MFNDLVEQLRHIIEAKQLIEKFCKSIIVYVCVPNKLIYSVMVQYEFEVIESALRFELLLHIFVCFIFMNAHYMHSCSHA